MKGPGFLLLLALNLACNQQAVFDYSHENGDHNNTYKCGDEKNDQGSVSVLPDAGFVSICESGDGRDYSKVNEYGCGNAYIDSVSQVETAMYCSN